MSKPWWKKSPERHGIRISLTRNLGTGCFVEGDESHMFEAVVNLLTNAAEEPIDRDGAISVQTYAAGDRVFLSVKDTGTGIPSGNLTKIFGPFWTTKHLSGAGMGLPGSLAVVKTSWGRDLGPRAGRITGPTSLSRCPWPRKRLRRSTLQVLRAVWTDLHIIVTDDGAVAKMLAEGLGGSGAQVFIAQSGSEGLAILEAQRVDVIVCDLAMPEMNGWEVAKAVSDYCKATNAPKPLFILITGWGGEIEDWPESGDKGVDLMLGKPVHLPKLFDVISQGLARFRE